MGHIGSQYSSGKYIVTPSNVQNLLLSSVCIDTGLLVPDVA